MARARHVVVLALVMFAIIGFPCAADSPDSIPDNFEDDYADLIGTRPVVGGGALPPNSVVAAPIGGPVPPGAFGSKDSAPTSASSSLHSVSAVAGAVTAALAGFFYF